MHHGQVWILTATRQGLLRAFCVLKRTDLKLPTRRMRLVDFQTLDPLDNLLPGLLRFAQQRALAEGFDVIEHLGCGLPKMRDFEVFAPYRRTLPCKPYYYCTPTHSSPRSWHVPRPGIRRPTTATRALT